MSLQQAASQKVLLAAHRGIAGANIPCNSIPAFQGALNQGADLIELDISRSLDGVLYVDKMYREIFADEEEEEEADEE